MHDPELAEVMGFAEDTDKVKILSRRATAVQAIRLLTGEAGEAVPPAAIMFTLTGRQDEGALGIATQADLGVLYRALDRAS